MPDSAKDVIGGTFEDIDETVVKPVVDEVGKAIEQGVQTVVAGPKPFDSTQGTKRQQSPSTQQEEQVKLAEARRKISWWKNLQAAQRAVSEKRKQQLMQTQQQIQQQKHIKQFEIVQKKKQLPPAIDAKGKVEIKRGVGG